MGTPRRIDVDSTWILCWYVENQILTNFQVISTYFFDVILLIEKSMSFPRSFFGVISMTEKTTLFPRSSFVLISLVEWSKLLPRTFFDVVSLVKNSTCTYFFDEILTGRNRTSFLVKLQANENIQGGFPVLVALNDWLL